MCDTCLRICNAIGELNNEEGNSVTILALNYDFDGPAAAIECAGEWTEYLDRRFEGDSVAECLEAAVTEKRAGTS